MKSDKLELVLLALVVIVTVVSVSFGLFDSPQSALAASPQHYPKSHPTPIAPAHFPWDRMPDGHFPPPFTPPTAYPGPTN